MQWNNTDVNNYATSTIHKYLNETYYNTLPQQDREKLGTKAVQEEFHGETVDDMWIGKQQYYGWGTMNVNVWLPSLSELVGTTGNQDATNGCYYSAMQGLNTSGWFCVDAQGGAQWKLFEAYNASGGGEAITNACNQEWSWLRSPDYGQNHSLMTYYNATGISSNRPATVSHAVHPAVSMQAPYLSLHCSSSPQKGAQGSPVQL